MPQVVVSEPFRLYDFPTGWRKIKLLWQPHINPNLFQPFRLRLILLSISWGDASSCVFWALQALWLPTGWRPATSNLGASPQEIPQEILSRNPLKLSLHIFPIIFRLKAWNTNPRGIAPGSIPKIFSIILNNIIFLHEFFDFIFKSYYFMMLFLPDYIICYHIHFIAAYRKSSISNLPNKMFSLYEEYIKI